MTGHFDVDVTHPNGMRLQVRVLHTSAVAPSASDPGSAPSTEVLGVRLLVGDARWRDAPPDVEVWAVAHLGAHPEIVDAATQPDPDELRDRLLDRALNGEDLA